MTVLRNKCGVCEFELLKSRGSKCHFKIRGGNQDVPGCSSETLGPPWLAKDTFSVGGPTTPDVVQRQLRDNSLRIEGNSFNKPIVLSD
jgi:hypothetical protein